CGAFFVGFGDLAFERDDAFQAMMNRGHVHILPRDRYRVRVDEDRLARMRLEYDRIGLDEAAAGHDPLALFRRWLNEVIDAGVPEPNAMALATADAHGIPSVRIVLLKGLDDRGAVFY